MRDEPAPPSGRPDAVRPRSGRRRLPALVAALLVLALGCGEDGSTEIAPPPATLVALSPAVDTVAAGERLDPPVSVRVENSVGDPMEGVPVRFLVASGEGRISNLAVSNGDGIAEAEFDAPSSPGASRIRVDIPSASEVSSLGFDVVTEPAAVVALLAVEGEDQAAEVESQLPLPFRVRATTPSGSPAGAVPLAWSLSDEGAADGARLSADTTYTGADGTASVLLTLGSSPGDRRVLVHAVGGVASDTVSFAAEARTRLEGGARLDSVRPLPLVAGSEARLFGAGFASDPTDNDVRIEGRPAEILEAGPSELVIRVPAFDERCLPIRDVGVRALVRGEPGNGEMLPLRPADPPLELQAGGAATLRGVGAVDCLHFAASSDSREYRVLVQSAATAGDAQTSLRLLTVTGTEPDAPAFALRSDVEPDPSAARAAREAASAELRLRRATRRELERRRASPARRARRDSAVSAAVVGSPAVGDTAEYRFAVGDDFTASCSDTTGRVRAVVRTVGDHTVLLEDVDAPAGGFGAEDWERLGSEIDDVIFPTDTAYFGKPADIDGNGRVALLFTTEVNRLNTPGASTGIGGFFLSLDLAASGRDGGGGRVGPGGEVCPASNEAELLYMLAPDPEGRVGDPVSVPRARRNALGIAAHELQHLINAERRVLGGEEGFGALEETWLDEGLSHLAEEVSGLRMAGLGPGTELSYADVTRTRETLELFNAFHINNFFQLSLYMLDPAGAPTLSPADPGGLGGLQMRGFAWFLLRWAADQSAGDERLMFRELAGGGPRVLRGIANVERATGRSWSDLLAEFSAAVAVDDAGVEDLASRLRVTSWDFRDVFASLNRNPAAAGRFPVAFPLAVTPLDVESGALRFDLGASTSRYFSLSLPAGGPPLAVGLSSPTGEPVSESAAPQITIVRTR